MMTKNLAPSTNATTSDRLTTVLSYGVLLLLISLGFRIYEPFLASLGWTAILVIFFYPMHHRLLRRFSATKAAVLSTLIVTFLLIVPAILVTTLFIREAFSVSRGMQHTLLVQQAPLLAKSWTWIAHRSEEHTSELQSRLHIVCRLLLEKKKTLLPQARAQAVA